MILPKRIIYFNVHDMIKPLELSMIERALCILLKGNLIRTWPFTLQSIWIQITACSCQNQDGRNTSSPNLVDLYNIKPKNFEDRKKKGSGSIKTFFSLKQWYIGENRHFALNLCHTAQLASPHSQIWLGLKGDSLTGIFVYVQERLW